MIEPSKQELEIIEKFVKKTAINVDLCIKKLQDYVNMITDENKKHNLIGKTTEKEIWQRHIIDSLQLVDFIEPNIKNITDLGSGSGLPAIVLAIATNKPIKMIEKSVIKANFLKKCCKALNIDAEIINYSINEDNILDILSSNTMITSRAFKSASIILTLLYNKQEQKIDNRIDKIVLLKGEKWNQEENEIPLHIKKHLKMKKTKSINKTGYIVTILK